MGKPSIGTAVTPELKKEKKQEIKELTILKDNSKKSIYNIIFSETINGSTNKKWSMKSSGILTSIS